MTTSSSRGLIRSMLITGTAQVISMLVALVRMKVLAVLLGPAGVGLLGIYNSLQSTAATVSGLGLGSSAVRQIATAKGEEAELSRVRLVLFTANLVQGALAMSVLWLLRDQLAVWFLGSDARSTEVGLLGVAVLLSLVAASQTALLRGMRRIGDLGRVTVIGALAGTATGLLAVGLAGEGGLVWFVIAQPLTSVAIAFFFTRKLPRREAARMSLRTVWDVWRPMASLGVVFMLGGLASTATLLLVRGLISRNLGIEAAGLFAASWGIAMQHIGLLLTAMAADYYPRLSEIIGDKAATSRLMNDQIQLCLALGGPFLLLLIGLAPWVMTLLYSAEFAAAAYMLQWQAVGNVLKLASWPLGFAFAAAAQSKLFLGVELFWNATFLGLLWLGLPIFGIEAAGTAFLVAYALYFAVLSLVVGRLHQFRSERLSTGLLAIHVTLSFGLFILAKVSPVAAVIACVPVSICAGAIGLRIVLIKVGRRGRLASKLASAYTALGWPLEKKSDL